MLHNFDERLDCAVVGVRTYQTDDSKWRRVLGLTMQIIAHIIVFDRAVVDSQCGFKCFGRNAARDIFQLCRTDGGMFDVEIFAIMHKLNTPLVYTPVHWANKAGSRINVLRCMIFDNVDMMGIKRNALMGKYSPSRLSSAKLTPVGADR
jgi:dolichyl-phosphate beta-glucosyltransferase